MLKKMVVPFLVKEFGEEEDFFTFEGYASTFGNIDLGDDVVMPGAFKDTIDELKAKGGFLPVLWQHNHDHPLGIFFEMNEDEKGLFVKGRMPKDDTFVSGRVIPQMKVGSINQMSIGYSCWGEGSFSVVDGIRQLHKVQLWEASLVTLPMNPEAVVTGMKTAVPFQDLPLANRDRIWDSVSAVGRVREFVGAEDGGLEDPDVQKKFRNAFLFYDKSDPDLFSSYKLPIADIIDGKMVAIPRAIFAAAGAMRGARGGVFLPSEDRPAITRNIERYYEKMGLDSPFNGEAGFRIDDIPSIDERTFEKMLKSGTIKFSSTVAKTIISRLKSDFSRDGEEEGSRDDRKALEGINESLKSAIQIINKEKGA